MVLLIFMEFIEEGCGGLLGCGYQSLSLKYSVEDSAPVEQEQWYTRSALYQKVDNAGFRYFERPMPMETGQIYCFYS